VQQPGTALVPLHDIAENTPLITAGKHAITFIKKRANTTTEVANIACKGSQVKTQSAQDNPSTADQSKPQ
jgi:hypothetical protein